MAYATGLVGFVRELDTSLSHQRKESQLRKFSFLPRMALDYAVTSLQ